MKPATYKKMIAHRATHTDAEEWEWLYHATPDEKHQRFMDMMRGHEKIERTEVKPLNRKSYPHKRSDGLPSTWHQWVYGGAVNPMKSNMTAAEYYNDVHYIYPEDESYTDNNDSDTDIIEVVNIGSKMTKYQEKQWNKLKISVFRKYKYHCAVKGCSVKGKKNLTVHHIIPRTSGGLNIYDNLIPLCNKHHDEVEIAGIMTRTEIENMIVESARELRVFQTKKVGRKVSSYLTEIAEACDHDYEKVADILGYDRSKAVTIAKIAGNPDVELPSDQASQIESQAISALDKLISEGKIKADKKRKRRIRKMRKALKQITNDGRLDLMDDNTLDKLYNESRHAVSRLTDEMS